MGNIWEIIVTFLLGIFTGVIGLYQFRNQQWGKIVSESRNTWINDFRNEISIIVAAIKMKSICTCTSEGDRCKKEEFCLNVFFEAEKARARLLTKLNTNNVNNGVATFMLNDILVSLDFCNDNLNQFEIIIELSKRILEPEWKKVKNEARGKKK